MYETKVTCTISLPGRIMYKESECQTRVKTPLLIKKGKNAGKQIKDKDGNPVFIWVKGVDLNKHDSFKITIKNRETKKDDTYTVFTRKCKPAAKVVKISDVAYYDMITKVPLKFKAPKGFIFDKKSNEDLKDDSDLPFKSLSDVAAWKKMTKEERVEWHLKQFAKDEGGYLLDYHIFKD